MSGPGVSKQLATWISSCRPEDIPENVKQDGLRSFVNWLGCAVGGSAHAATKSSLAALRPYAGAPQASVIGHRVRLDALNAAFVNGVSSHILDFDDTHLRTILHPTGPVAAAALAMAEARGLSGSDLLNGMIVGVETECRIANAICPEHYDAGWHITGTAGVFGATTAVARLINLDAKRTNYALGLAATQASGLREMFATMGKSFHVGSAAKNGIGAALLAEQGFESSEQSIEAPFGFANVMSTKQDLLEVTSDLGNRWETSKNAFKPFACGIVLHPIIDCCLQLSQKFPFCENEIDTVSVRSNPLVLKLAGNISPRNGLEAKLSVFHAAAVALLRGDGSPTAYTDEIVSDEDIIALGKRITVISEPTISISSAECSVLLKGGRVLSQSVEFAVGGYERPMTNQELEQKFIKQAAAILGQSPAERLLESSWNLRSVVNLQDMAPQLTGPL